MMLIDGERVTDTYDIWSAEFQLRDGPQEVIFVDGEIAAREALSSVPGTLYVRQAYSTATRPVAYVKDRVPVTSLGQLN
jgi:hypothetical protein